MPDDFQAFHVAYVCASQSVFPYNRCVHRTMNALAFTEAVSWI